MAAKFKYQDPFPLAKDNTRYRLLTKAHVSTAKFNGKEVLKVKPAGLVCLANQAMREVNFFLRPAHLEKVAAILEDPEASPNDRGVAVAMLRNAEVAAGRVLPFCQDTGTATVVGKKGQRVFTDCKDEEYLSRGIFKAYIEENLRYSQNAPLTMYDEVNTECNLPAQIDLYATEGMEYRFLFVAKGGGSANKTYLFQETKATLNPGTLPKFLMSKIKAIGTAACPPYHIAVVVGGTSPELVLKTVKLASARYLDGLPTKGSPTGHAFRDLELEAQLLGDIRRLGLGAQFGGKYFALDVRVIRLPRHGASCPIGLGVSCNADRNIKAKITRDGIFIEKLETNPAKYLTKAPEMKAPPVAIDLNRPMNEIRATLSKYPVATRLSLSGPIIVARDIAHAKLKELLDKGGELPAYIKDHIVYYAGPAKTPPGYASGSLGPTTAGRMDDYVPIFQKAGGSLVMLAKGNRSKVVTDSCKTYGGFYLGSIGGPAARLGKDCITSQEVLAYPELGMEAIFKITVKDFPAFILVDDKGNDFYARFMA